MAIGRRVPYAVLVGDGTVLVVGNDQTGCVRPDSVTTDIWDPSSRTWSAGPSLNKPRAEFAAAPVADGRALVTGGVNPGDGAYSDTHQSYSSTYVYDPGAAASWSRAALLGAARTAPTSASLLDGRVLVAGGYYLSGATGSVPKAELAAFRSSSSGGLTPGGVILADTDPITKVAALATAELYDPATDSWSATGPLRFARVGAPAVMLVDGRVLVAGSSWGGSWNSTRPEVNDRAYETAEIYDPRTGRFSLTGDLPPMDWSSLSKLGQYRILGDQLTSTGTLVGLADGGALLIGRVHDWDTAPEGYVGSTVSTLRFDPDTGRWAEIDQSVLTSTFGDEYGPIVETVRGHSRAGALAARLVDGHVLVTGGFAGGGFNTDTFTNSADLYDPATDSWSALPPMPEPRAEGAAVALADGSVLVVGGSGAIPTSSEADDRECWVGATGISSAVRFVPGP